MNTRPSAKERAHMARVKELACSVCDQPGPSDAHHIKQSDAYLCVALCKDCHQGAFNGWHGQRRIWSVNKMDEYSALGVTIRRLLESA
jgi:hypothetical protein